MSNTDYEQLYHLINRRRGEELRQLEALQKAVAALIDTFLETDRQVAQCAETQGEPPLELLQGRSSLPPQSG